MGIQKLGITLSELCARYAKACGKSTILCKPVHVPNIDGLRHARGLTEDIFVKTEQSLKEIISKHNLNSYINETYFIGEGAEGAVYRIGNTPYALKVPHIGDIFTQGTIRGKSVDISKLNLSVTPQDRVNNIVGHIGDAQILTYIEGENIIEGLSSSSPSRAKIMESINNLSIDNIKSYFRTLVSANRVGMMHDYSGSNSIINCATGKIIPIDFWPGQDFKLLNSLIDQCAMMPKRVGGTDNQNNLLKKGIIAILEMVKEGTISAKEVDISKVHLIFNETAPAKQMIALCKSFTKYSSVENINRILAELKSLA